VGSIRREVFLATVKSKTSTYGEEMLGCSEHGRWSEESNGRFSDAGTLVICEDGGRCAVGQVCVSVGGEGSLRVMAREGGGEVQHMLGR